MEGYMIGYIDPAVGATIMQLIVAGTVGIGAVIKLKWETINKLFTRVVGTGDDAIDSSTQITDAADRPAESQS
jgi:hypothetical protein